MRYLVFSLCLLVPSAVVAQEEKPPSMMDRGAQTFLEGLLNEMEPALKGLQGFVEEMGPALSDILKEVEDWSIYEVPEMLPNGDIIIRRKPDPEAAPTDDPAEPTIEL